MCRQHSHHRPLVLWVSACKMCRRQIQVSGASPPSHDNGSILNTKIIRYVYQNKARDLRAHNHFYIRKYVCSFTDYNECELNDTVCDENGTCTYTLGSYQCDCNRGYSGDGDIYCNSMLSAHIYIITFSFKYTHERVSRLCWVRPLSLFALNSYVVENLYNLVYGFLYLNGYNINTCSHTS